MSPGQAGDSFVEKISRRVATRYTRRSLMGQVGRGSVVLAAGGTVAGLDAASSLAHNPPPQCPGLSIACGNLTGSNQCPGGTCNCGWWRSSGPCGNTTLWSDCCGNCHNGNDCSCRDAGGGNLRPSCCNHKQHGTGCASMNGDIHIKCRAWHC